jgi:hypothetical protein
MWTRQFVGGNGTPAKKRSIARQARLSTNWRRSVPDYDEEVGYGKPPKSTRFKKGQSGNPKGRPKEARNLATIVAEVCRERVRVKSENGKYYYMTKMEAIMKQLTNQAAKGDIKAARASFAIINMFPEVKEPAPLLPPILNIHFVDGPGRPGSMEDHHD